jgi:Ring hydroxylating beta subunit
VASGVRNRRRAAPGDRRAHLIKGRPAGIVGLPTPRAHLSQEPRSRTSRMIGNVTLEETGDDAVTVRSKFQLLEYRRETQRSSATPVCIVSCATAASASPGSASIS